jgi:hypothetical protein
VGLESTPSLGDLDGDGDLDLLAGENEGTFRYFANTGDATSPAFAPATTNPFGLAEVGLESAPSLGDLDGDGDLDLVACQLNNGSFFYFENTGDATSPAFAPATTNPFGLADLGIASAPTLGDLDGDGDLDLVAGESGGTFTTYYLPEPGQGLLLGAGLAWLELLRRRRRPRERPSKRGRA